MDEIKFNAWIARDRISDDGYDDYPRTFLFDKNHIGCLFGIILKTFLVNGAKKMVN